MMMLKNLHDEITARTVRYLNRIEKPVMVYVGSWDGRLAKRYMQNVKGLTLHAIEPDPKSFRKTCMHLKGFKHAYCHQLAITDHDGTVDLMSSAGNVSNSLFQEPVERKKKRVDTIKVPCETMGHFFENCELERVDLLKVNCVGGEYKMFGWPDTPFLRKVQKLMVEIHCIEPFGTDKFCRQRSLICETLKLGSLSMELGVEKGAGIKFYSQLWGRNV